MTTKKQETNEMNPDETLPVDENGNDVELDAEMVADPESIADHEDPIVELEQQVGEWQARYQRALADFQNFQRRSIANEQEARRQGTISVLQTLLGFADNLERALSIDLESATPEQIHSGVCVIRDELHQLLSGHSVSKIAPEPNDEFDPEKHEAMIQTPSSDVDAGHVLMTLQIGYAMGDRVLRPAKVSIATEPAEPAADEEA